MKIRFPQRRYPAMVKPNQKIADDDRKKHDQENYKNHLIRKEIRNKSRHKK
jgi:hypothetical protein